MLNTLGLNLSVTLLVFDPAIVLFSLLDYASTLLKQKQKYKLADTRECYFYFHSKKWRYEFSLGKSGARSVPSLAIASIVKRHRGERHKS